MAKMRIETVSGWITIIVAPITKKTNNDFKKRIPTQTKMWRPTYLNKVVNEPSMTIEEWSEVPYATINDIYDCIQEMVSLYDYDNNLLIKTMDEMDNKVSGENLDKEIKFRNKLIEEIEDIEKNEKIFKFDKKKILKIRKKNNLS